MIRRIAAAAAALIVGCICIGGCSGTADSNGAAKSNSTAAASGTTETYTGAKLADSMKQYAQSMLDDPQYEGMGDKQIALLNEVIANDGAITRGEYEKAVSNYNSCVVERGYAPLSLHRYDNGLYEIRTFRLDGHDLTEEESQAASDDVDQCRTQEVLAIHDLYAASLGNSDLASDQNEATVHCMKTAGVVDASYTAKKFQEETDVYWNAAVNYGGDTGIRTAADEEDFRAQISQSLSFDLDDKEVMNCLIANELDTYAPDYFTQEAWRPFG